MIDIYHCFFCNGCLLTKKNLNNKKYFFWCNKKCHDSYEDKIEKQNHEWKSWSDFMCKPEIKTNNSIEKVLPSTKFPKKKAKNKTKKRICGNCKQPGHNKRTCKK